MHATNRCAKRWVSIVRLVSVEIQKYKRFEQPVKIDVSGDVIAFVGPNEAGKSTLLEAMRSLDEGNSFTDRERTRYSGNDTMVRCAYVLEQSDRDALIDIPGTESIQWWSIEKSDSGLRTRLFPTPKRDLTSRHVLAELLQEFLTTDPLQSFNAEGAYISSGEQSMAAMAEDAIAALASEVEDLNSAELEAIRTFANAASELPERNGDEGEESEDVNDEDEVFFSSAFLSFAEELADYQEGPAPQVLSVQRLRTRRPRFVEFSADDRDLLTSYDLAAVLDDIPQALQNLASLAKLDLRGLLNASIGSKPTLRREILDDANAELKHVFSSSWRQSSVSVHLEIQGSVLEILVTLPAGGYSEFGDRSQGFKWFVALRAFMAQFDLDEKPIILFDEAETHLHYDAQVDIVTLFTNQEVAAKVIYTTHSAGCLPRDLGNGIRVVAPIPNTDRSTVRNSIWVDDEIGFSSLVFAMGATTFAFLPARYVLLGEGATDAMLYPTLFREAAGLGSLTFQVAPGLAVVSAVGLPQLTSEGGTVAFVVDGDKDGKGYQRALLKAGVAQDHIVCLHDVFQEELQLEDLVLAEHLTDAVNHLLRVYQQATVEYPAERLPTFGRLGAISTWCVRRKLKMPSKRAIVQRLLDMKSEAAQRGETLQLLDPARTPALKATHDKLNVLFGAAT